MKFSVITVCLNSVRTIERTIQSVISQKNADLEYIVIDGGSTDGTLEVIKKYEKEIHKWISEPDKGLYDAMNKGIDMAAGDVISFLNSDDWYEKDIFPLLEETFVQSECDIVAARQAMLENDEIVGYSAKRRLKSDLYFDMIYSHPALFAQKRLFLQYGKFNLCYKVCADYDWILKIYEHGAKIECIDFITTNFTLGGLSAGKECMGERRQISLMHLPEHLREQNICKIEESYQKGIMVYKFESAIKKMNERIEEKEKMKRILGEKLQWSECCNLLGMGMRARECFNLLNALDMRVGHIYDNSTARQGMKYRGRIIEKPENTLDGNFWIITSTIYEKELENQIKEMGVTCYARISDLMGIIVKYVQTDDDSMVRIQSGLRT